MRALLPVRRAAAAAAALPASRVSVLLRAVMGQDMEDREVVEDILSHLLSHPHPHLLLLQVLLGFQG